MNLHTLSVRGKLNLAFGILAAIILFVAILAAKDLSDANQRFAQFVEGVNARLLQSYEVRTGVDRRALLARDMAIAATPQEREALKAEITQLQAHIRQNLSKLMHMAAEAGVPEDVKKRIARIDEIEQRYTPVALGIVQLAYEGKREEAITRIHNDCRPLLAALTQATQDYRDATVERSEQLVAQAAEEYAWQRGVLIGSCLTAFLAAALAGWLISRSLMASLGAEPRELGEVAQRVASGDLGPVPGAAHAHAGSVLASLAEMQQGLARIVSQVRSNSDNIATASSQIAVGNADLSQRTEEQASNLQQTAASMEELSSTVQTSASTAQEARQLAAGAASAAEHGGQVVGQVVSTMRDISASSQKISDIIGVIDGIAFQTNILALNAAVEAARAGEQGRGFAVVAGEVRVLAQRSAEAAKEIKSLIGASVERVETGARQVDDAGASMHEIVTQVQRVSQMISELTLATVEQSQGITQVGDAVQQLDQVTQRNAALVEENAAAAESLRHQAAQLREAMSVFRVDV